jgi:murein DD-endopeptidase MepM/ murein hydrolase activator NlpD
MLTILKILSILISPIHAHTDIEIFNDNPVTVQWYEYGEGYEYMTKLFQIKGEDETLIFTSDWLDENILELEIDQEGSYLWQTYIREINKTCEEKHQCWNIDSGYFDLYLPQEQESVPDEKENEVEDSQDERETTETVIEERKEEVTKEPEVKVKPKPKVLGSSTKKKTPEKSKEESKKEDNVVKEENVKKSIKEKSNYCEYEYNIDKKKFTLKKCELEKPKIVSANYYKYKDNFVVSSKGQYVDKIKVYIENTVCKHFDLLNTKTWFNCQEVVIGNNEYTVDLNHEVYFYKNRIISPSNYIFKDSSYEISAIYNTIPTHLFFKSYFSLNHRGSWLDQQLSIKGKVNFKEGDNGSSQSSGIYNFPFSKIVHVNQWHGCTSYQCPHKGIDFAAVKDNIYASDNGIVVSKGYDTYYGECNSGGKYLVVKYDGGHHMAYLHLKKSYVNVNQKVKKGDLIALSGNTGAKNCQPLGYHLHFELREGRRQSTHIDPVPYINVDWNLVKTNKSDVFPKRLSGDNPHSTF